jgi:8-oxo-dGTP diphosphatase
MRPIVSIAVAIVEHDGKYLLQRRRKGQVLADKWEFPGGKIESGESPAVAAVRETLEETDLVVRADRTLLEFRYAYEHATVQLHFIHCVPIGGATPAREGLRWVTAAEFNGYDFPAANAPLLRMLGAE